MMLSSLTLTSKICTPHRAASPPEILFSVRVRLSLLSAVSPPKSAYWAVGELLLLLTSVVRVIVALDMGQGMQFRVSESLPFYLQNQITRSIKYPHMGHPPGE